MAIEVLVTGASGVLGREVVRQLRDAACKVWSCTRTPCEESDSVWNILGQDAPEPDCTPTVVVHCAARIGRLKEPYSEAWAHFAVNVMGTLKVTNWCLARGVRRLILTSSAIVYGEWQDRPKSERDAIRPWAAGPYAASKACAEHAAEVMAYAGGELTILRLSSLYGGGYRTGLIPRLLSEGMETHRIKVYTPISSFALLHVDDAARTVASAVFAGKAGLWTVGSEKLTTILELAEVCARQVDARVVVSEGSPDQPGRIVNWVDDSRARTDLGHRNSITLEAGVSQIHRALFQ
ncbi:MAG: NAD(P)-dependent oxidoreductase [Desulfomonile tiedjei]|nr:NAD(P)-dependent oxidoreductase [Desulfomonile tiedjei]